MNGNNVVYDPGNSNESENEGAGPHSPILSRSSSFQSTSSHNNSYEEKENSQSYESDSEVNYGSSDLKLTRSQAQDNRKPNKFKSSHRTKYSSKSNDLESAETLLIPNKNKNQLDNNNEHQSYWGRRVRKFRYGIFRISRSQAAWMFMHIMNLLILWTLNNVFWMFVSVGFGLSYGFFVDQLTTLLLLMMGVPPLLFRMWKGDVPPERRRAATWRYVLVGFMDAGWGLFSTMGSPNTPGVLQTLIGQIPIPLCMLFTYIVFGARFTRGQYLGATIIIAGAALVLGPALVDPSSMGSQTTTSAVIVYTMAYIFFAISSVLKEDTLKDEENGVDMMYFSMGEQAWAWFITFFMAPVIFIPGMGNDTPSNIFSNFYGGMVCFWSGVSTVDPDADCSGVWSWTLAYVLCNLLMNLYMLVVMKAGSSVLMNLVNALQLPVCTIILSQPSLVGDAIASPLTSFVWGGLVLILSGFLMYQFVPLEKDSDVTGSATTSSAYHRGTNIGRAQLMVLDELTTQAWADKYIVEKEQNRKATKYSVGMPAPYSVIGSDNENKHIPSGHHRKQYLYRIGLATQGAYGDDVKMTPDFAERIHGETSSPTAKSSVYVDNSKASSPRLGSHSLKKSRSSDSLKTSPSNSFTNVAQIARLGYQIDPRLFDIEASVDTDSVTVTSKNV